LVIPFRALVGLSAFTHKRNERSSNPPQEEKFMLLTPTFVGLLLAGTAFWALVWAAIHKLDEIPYLKEFTSTQEVLDWIDDRMYEEADRQMDAQNRFNALAECKYLC
jgi:hypothetical protein